MVLAEPTFRTDMWGSYVSLGGLLCVEGGPRKGILELKALGPKTPVDGGQKNEMGPIVCVWGGHNPAPL